MKEKTRLLFDRLEAQRGRIIKQYSRLSSEQLQYKPAPDEWNLLQVMCHLITAEKQSIAFIQRNMSRIDTIPKSGIKSSLRHFLLKTALYLPLKFKAPKLAEVHEEAPNLDEMKAEWESVRAGLKTLLEESGDETLSKAVYKHPRAGLLNMKQALEFFESHIAHHQKQIDSLVTDSKT